MYPANGALIAANCCIVQIGFMNGGREETSASRDQPRLEGPKKKRRKMMMMLKKMMTKKEEGESPFFSFALSFSLPLFLKKKRDVRDPVRLVATFSKTNFLISSFSLFTCPIVPCPVPRHG